MQSFTNKNLVFEESDKKTSQTHEDLINACYNNSIVKMEDLLNQGVDVNCRNNSGGTCLHIACQNNYLEIAEMLIKRGVDVNLLTIDGWTALHFSAQKGYLELSSLLINANIKLDVAGIRYRRTALHYAADQGEDKVVNLLLKSGAKSDLKDINGQTPLDIALQKSHQKVIDILSKFEGFR